MLKGMSRQKAPIIFKSGVPVSVVCVAATFTGVTYANNGGKVQLVSAGVHGLTTSPAVGASVYVSWAGGTGVSGLYSVLSVDDTLKFTIDLVYAVGFGTPTVAVANTYVPFLSIQMPVLSIDSRLELSAGMTMTATATLRELSFFLGSSAISARNTSSATDITIAITGFLQNRGQNSQICSLYKTRESVSTIPFEFLSINTSIPQFLKISAKTAAANVLARLEHYIVEVYV